MGRVVSKIRRSGEEPGRCRQWVDYFRYERGMKGSRLAGNPGQDNVNGKPG